MTRKMRWIWLVAAPVTLLGCRDDSGPPAGTEGGPCYGNGTCNEGLVCNEEKVCVPEGADPCEGVDCSGHGTCEVQDGQASCRCEEGYHAQGLECVSDEDPCAGVDCSGHGTCQVQDGQARCVCEDGYRADGLTCVPNTLPPLGQVLEDFEYKLAHYGSLLADYAVAQGGFDNPDGGNPGTHYDAMYAFARGKQWIGDRGLTGDPYDSYVQTKADLGLAAAARYYLPLTLQTGGQALPGYHAYGSRGLWLHYGSGPVLDEPATTLEHIRGLRDNPAYSAAGGDIRNFGWLNFIESREREVAWRVLAHVYAERAGEPRAEALVGWRWSIEGFVKAECEQLYRWRNEVDRYAHGATYNQPFMLGLLLHALAEFYDHEIESGRDPNDIFPTNMWLILEGDEGLQDIQVGDTVEYDGRQAVVASLSRYGYGWRGVEITAPDGSRLDESSQNAWAVPGAVVTVGGVQATIRSFARSSWDGLYEAIVDVARRLANMDGDGFVHMAGPFAGQPLWYRFRYTGQPYPDTFAWDDNGDHWGFPLRDNSGNPAPDVFGEIIFIYGWLGWHEQDAEYFVRVGDELLRSITDYSGWEMYRDGKHYNEILWGSIDYLDFRSRTGGL